MGRKRKGRAGEQGVRFRRKLLAWWARAARDLPWRRTRDPYRVLRRVFFDRATGNVQRATKVWELARALVPKDGKRAWKFNQAIMELGALICVARRPKCEQCPVRPDCRTGRARS